MIAAGGVLLLMLVGFALEGLFSGNEEETSSGEGSDATEDSRVSDGYDASVYTSDLHDLLFGDDGMGNPGGSSAEAPTQSANILDDLDMSDDTDTDGQDAPDTEQPEEGDVNGTGTGDEFTGEDGLILFGQTAADALAGGDGDDALFGEDGDDSLDGGAGDDTLDGGEGADTLDGGDDDDTLILGEGDEATGGDGEDTFSLLDELPENVPVLTDFMSGVDTILVRYDGETPPEITFEADEVSGSTSVFSDGEQILHLFGTTDLSMDDVVLEQEPSDPTGGDDSLSGSDDDDTIAGGDGNDTIDGLNGDDLLNGGTGDDVLRGRSGMDELFGETGADALTGGYGDDLVSGGAQNDLAFGNEGDDTVSGEAGNDELHGDDGNDALSGGTGHDLLHGGDGNDSMDGGAGNDLLFGAGGDDSLDGGDGDDYLLGGLGADALSGGEGNDTLDGTFTEGDDAFGPYDEDVTDSLLGGEGDDHLFLGEGDIGVGGDGADIFESGAYIEDDSGAAVVTDFDPNEDRIQVSVDLEASPNPDIAVVDFADGTGADIIVDGTVVLRISGAQGLDPDAILVRDIRLDDLAETA